MKHILFIDEIERLNIKKDSSLLLALELQNAGYETFLMFKSDFYYYNHDEKVSFDLHSFSGRCFSDSCYIETFNVNPAQKVFFDVGDIIHMRLDPPFDSRYLRYLWMLQGIEKKGVTVINSPAGIMNHNEKLYAYEQAESMESYVGESTRAFCDFTKKIQADGYRELILKPLDLFQGIGVEKFSIEDKDLMDIFIKKVDEYGGPVIAQPFYSNVRQGEIRTIYYKGVELGSIIKRPSAGSFLANIASGATYESCTLTIKQKQKCDKISKELMSKRVDWIAFDILENAISEVNITCPGLLVEVAQACQNNLVPKLVELMNQ